MCPLRGRPETVGSLDTSARTSRGCASPPDLRPADPGSRQVCREREVEVAAPVCAPHPVLEDGDDDRRGRRLPEAEDDLRAPLARVEALVEGELAAPWLRENVEERAVSYAIEHLVPKHFGEVRRFREELVVKTAAAVKDRLTKEINYWDHRAAELRAQEQAGRVNARLNSAKARERANDLEGRLRRRMEELEQERRLSPLPPVVVGGALVVPIGLIRRLKGESRGEPALFARQTRHIEHLAMEAVLATERGLAREPRDVSGENLGYDVESKIPGAGRLLFIEVKGRAAGATTVTITKNEILTALNKPDDFILALVEVDGDVAREPVYVRRPFQKEPDFGVTSVNYELKELLRRGEAPS